MPHGFRAPVADWQRSSPRTQVVSSESTRKRSSGRGPRRSSRRGPASSEYRGFQPQRLCARAVPASSRSTSLAAGRYALVVGFDRDRPAQPAADRLDQLADRDVLAAADIDGSAEGRVAAGDRDEAGDRVLDIRQVAARVEPAELDHVAPAPG